MTELKEKFEVNNNHANKPDKENKTPVFAYLLIVFGIIFLFERIFMFSFFGFMAWRYIWPLVLILLGIYLVAKKNKQ